MSNDTTDTKDRRYQKKIAAKLAQDLDSQATQYIVHSDDSLAVAELLLKHYEGKIAEAYLQSRSDDELALTLKQYDEIVKPVQKAVDTYKWLRSMEGKDIYFKVEENFENLGWILTQARIARRLTKEQLSELLGVQKQYIRYCEQTLYAGYKFAVYLSVLEVLGAEYKDGFVRLKAEYAPKVGKILHKYEVTPPDINFFFKT